MSLPYTFKTYWFFYSSIKISLRNGEIIIHVIQFYEVMFFRCVSNKIVITFKFSISHIIMSGAPTLSPRFSDSLGRLRKLSIRLSSWLWFIMAEEYKAAWGRGENMNGVWEKPGFRESHWDINSPGSELWQHTWNVLYRRSLLRYFGCGIVIVSWAKQAASAWYILKFQTVSFVPSWSTVSQSCRLKEWWELSWNPGSRCQWRASPASRPLKGE